MKNRKKKFSEEQAVMELADGDLDQVTGGIVAAQALPELVGEESAENSNPVSETSAFN